MPDENENPWWATPPIDWSLPEPPKVRDLLMHAYDERMAVKLIVTQAGLRWPTAPGGAASAQELWMWAIETAVKSGVLFELFGQVLADESRTAFHGPLKTLFGGLAMGYSQRLGPDGYGTESLESLSKTINDGLRAAASDAGGGLQSVNTASLGFIDARSDLQMRRDALRRTAMIEVAGRPAGTGVLVGPDLLLTAAHVLDATKWPPQLGDKRVVAIFDFVPSATRSPAETGVRIAIAETNLAGSLPTTAERNGRASDWNAKTTHLDFALLRLERAAADDSEGGSSRGFYPLVTDAHAFDDNAHLRIPQHPLGQTQVTAPMAGPFEKNPNETRVRYKGNTLPGSSGSAVLDMRGRLVAMHHFAKRGLNQGVLIDSIARHIENAGIALPQASVSGATNSTAAPSTAAHTAVSTPDPFETTRFGRRPFVNRTYLRDVVKTMLKSGEGRILVIDGGQDAGKTYSWHYLKHLEAQRDHPKVKERAPKGMRAVKVDLDQYTDVPRDRLRAEIVQYLCKNLGLVPVETLAQPVRSIADFATLLDNRLNGTDFIWWIFFDSLDRHVLEHGEVKELIAALSQIVDETPALPLRLVLSSRETVSLPGDVMQWAERDHADGLSRSDVEAWLRKRATEAGRSVDDSILAEKLDAAFPKNAPPPAADAVAPSLPKMLDAVLGGTP